MVKMYCLHLCVIDQMCDFALIYGILCVQAVAVPVHYFFDMLLKGNDVYSRTSNTSVVDKAKLHPASIVKECVF